MATLVVRLRILPTDVDVDLNKLAKKIKEKTSSVAELHKYYIEPIAFGLSALIADFLLEEREGGTEPLENILREVEGVGGIDVIAVSRSSVKL